jgi:hypothetical protein
MAEQAASLPHLQNRACQGPSPPLEYAPTLKARLSFGISDRECTQADSKSANANPFVDAGEEVYKIDFLQKLREDLKGGWSFQEKKKLPVRLASPRQEPTQFPSHTP